MKKNFVIGILVCLLTFLSGCSTATRYNTFVPMEQSCMLIYKESYTDETQIGFMDGKSVDFKDSDRKYIIPAGHHTLKGGVILKEVVGKVRVERSGKGPYGTYTDVSYHDKMDYHIIPKVEGTVDLEPGKWYYFDNTEINVTPTEDKEYFTDKDGKLYHIDNVYYRKVQDKYYYYIYTFVAKEIEGKLGKTYFIKENPMFVNFGVRYPNMIGVELGTTLGFAFFSDPINVHFYGDSGIIFGLGVRDYQFSKLADDSSSVLLPPPGVHYGLTVDFEIGKWGMGISGGIIGTLISLFQVRDDIEILKQFWSPYIQLTFGRSYPYGCLFIDYYPGVEPLYSAFGIGWRYRW